MTTIGVYDSGIGGLTTLAALMRRLPRCSFRYYADNARMPFGTKTAEEVKEAVCRALSRMRRECDAIVLGCNTASVTADPPGVFKLRPRLDEEELSSVLLLATPLTLSRLRADYGGFMSADTGELAVLVEITASLRYKGRRPLDMSVLGGYLSEKLPRCAPRRILLGCSHYIYLSREISRLYPGASVVSGNLRLAEEVAGALGEKPENDGLPALPSAAEEGARVKTVFTGEREERKYRWLLSRLLTAPRESL